MIWVVSAYCRENQKVVRFSVGKRTNKTLNQVLISLKLSEAQTIFTDKLKNYRFLIEKKIHHTTTRSTNHVEIHCNACCFTENLFVGRRKYLHSWELKTIQNENYGIEL